MLHKQRVFQILIEGLTTGPNYCAVSHFHTHPIGLQTVAGRQSRAWPLAHCPMPDYWGAEIDCGPRSMYTLPRCLITGGRDWCTPCHGAWLLGGRDRCTPCHGAWLLGGRDRCTPCHGAWILGGGARSTGGRDRCTPCHGAWLLGAEIDVHPATVPDYWRAEIDVDPAMVPDYWGAEIDVRPATVPESWGGGEIDWGPRSMYTLPRCLITGGPRSTGGRDQCTPCHVLDYWGTEIDVRPATVPDYWRAEIDVRPATVPDYWVGGARSMYTLPRCLITGGAEIDWGPRSMYTLHVHTYITMS